MDLKSSKILAIIRARNQSKSQFFDVTASVPSQGRVVICCIAKNEQLYIREWVDHHLALGFDMVYVYDNGSDIPIEQTLETYVTANTVKVLRATGRIMQIPSYNHFTANFAAKHDFCAFIDCDEFIILKKHQNVLSLCQDYLSAESSAGALAINWMIFGSNGLTSYDARPVVERFTKRGAIVNQNIKCIVRCSTLQQYSHPHYPTRLIGYIVDTDRKVVNPPFNQFGPVDVCQINHYFAKSRSEFYIKQQRGRSDTDAKRPLSNFEGHDENDVEDLSALILLQNRRA